MTLGQTGLSGETVAALRSLIARRQPGYSLEAPFYTSPEIFQADMEIIFGRTWIYVAVEPEIPEPGDYVTVTLGKNAVVILRDDDMGLRAFHNVCRHRGAKLVQAESGAVGNLVCPYHQWTYDLEGKLIYAEHMGAEFDKSCFGLKPVHVRSIEGLIFICLAKEPPADIDEMARVMTPYLAPHDIRNTKVAASVDLIERGNWKLTLENNRECYHCAGNHPELTIPLFAYGFGFAPGQMDETELEQAARYDQLVVESHARWESCGVPSAEVDHLDDLITGYRTQRLPIDQSGESQTMDTRVACRKLLGTLTDTALGGLSFWTQPNSWHHFMSDHIVTFTTIPLDAETTLVRTKWLVHKDAREGVDYEIDNLTSVWNATNAQDAALVEYAQAGARTAAYEPGPYSPYTETLVEKFCKWYLDRLQAGMS
ncbi:MAG TPA: aromatic ring-hydroxylating dioxygenase subunit alpha [Acidisoma sp.]|uniref:aromatic ring-hydroxylating oxygenase subunit alpha n=1 Tax=Acidisoma sp. TaxID=1872115 RepID=UPI002C493B0D|nr:aromatic ring-hydroxylating dioxygenase subunit alpha [Acidisoma sp.]HTH99311.1 aromatic ring-hydroxylating dioxygenase subunit alpha [Acidisoma sp.]